MRARRSARAASILAAAAAALVLSVSTLATSSQNADTGASAPVRRLQQDINEILATPTLQAGTWGISVRSLARPETLFEINSSKLLVPSSNMKILTLAAAAERLGWNFTFATSLSAAGVVTNGTLEGDLVVSGTGDPNIDDWDGAATRLFQDWAAQLKSAGVHAVSGRIVGDDDAFEDNGLGAGWAWDDLDRSFGTSIGALQFNENTAQLKIAPGTRGGVPASIVAVPDSAALVVRNLVTTGPPGSALALSTRRFPGSTTLDVSGSIALGSAPVVRLVSVVNPTLYFVNHLRSVLIASGIDVRGPAADIDDAANPPRRSSRTPIVTFRSPPLSELAATMMRLSQNLFAESLLKALGAWSGTPTTAGGIAAVRKVMDEWGIPASGYQQADGSGLSRYNLVTAGTLAAVLARVHDDARLREPFRDALPLAGRAGTLENRMRGTPAQGNARAKTGSLTNAQALSGYVMSADGEPLVFSIVANNFGVPSENVDRVIDAVVVRLSRFTRK